MFPTGVVPVTPSLPLAPILIMKKMTWADAQKYCRGVYFDLATAKTAVNWWMLGDMLAEQSVTGPVWLGLYNDFDTWRWSLNDILLENIALQMWLNGEPNNFAGHECCAAIDKNGQWCDNSCTSAKAFICYHGESTSGFKASAFLIVVIKSRYAYTAH